MVADIADAFRQSVQSRLTFAMTRLSEYLSDRKTEIVLLKPMQVCISHSLLDLFSQDWLNSVFYDMQHAKQGPKISLDDFK